MCVCVWLFGCMCMYVYVCVDMRKFAYTLCKLYNRICIIKPILQFQDGVMCLTMSVDCNSAPLYNNCVKS